MCPVLECSRMSLVPMYTHASPLQLNRRFPDSSGSHFQFVPSGLPVLRRLGPSFLGLAD